MNGTSVLIKIKTDSQRALSVLPTCEDTMKTQSPTKNRASPEPDHPDTLISDFWPQL